MWKKCMQLCLCPIWQMHLLWCILSTDRPFFSQPNNKKKQSRFDYTQTTVPEICEWNQTLTRLIEVKRSGTHFNHRWNKNLRVTIECIRFTQSGYPSEKFHFQCKLHLVFCKSNWKKRLNSLQSKTINRVNQTSSIVSKGPFREKLINNEILSTFLIIQVMQTVLFGWFKNQFLKNRKLWKINKIQWKRFVFLLFYMYRKSTSIFPYSAFTRETLEVTSK